MADMADSFAQRLTEAEGEKDALAAKRMAAVLKVEQLEQQLGAANDQVRVSCVHVCLRSWCSGEGGCTSCRPWSRGRVRVRGGVLVRVRVRGGIRVRVTLTAAGNQGWYPGLAHP